MLSAEARRRLEGAQRSADEQTPEQVQAARGVRVLEQINSAESWRLLRALAAGEPAAYRTREAAAALRRHERRPPSE